MRRIAGWKKNVVKMKQGAARRDGRARALAARVALSNDHLRLRLLEEPLLVPMAKEVHLR